MLSQHFSKRNAGSFRPPGELRAELRRERVLVERSQSPEKVVPCLSASLETLEVLERGTMDGKARQTILRDDHEGTEAVHHHNVFPLELRSEESPRRAPRASAGAIPTVVLTALKVR